MSFQIEKSFDFCYGHRVYTQNLIDKNAQCTCRHLHGHNGRVTVRLSSDSLDQTGMVTDFKNLEFFKKILDDDFDHKMILGADDPYLEYVLPKPCGLYCRRVYGEVVIRGLAFLGACEINADLSCLREVSDGIIVIDRVPTSEVLAELFYKILESECPTGVKVDSVSLSETGKSNATYFG